MNHRTLPGRHLGIVAEAVTIRGRGDQTMFAVVSRPTITPRGATALVILGKTGPGDVWRWLAESLARRGFLVVRFEPSGIGDSPGGDPDVDIPVEEYFRGVQEGAFTDNTTDVLNWVRRTYEPADLYALGICANCSSVLRAAAALRDTVSGLILVTPAVLYVTPRPGIRSHDAQAIGRGYLRRFLHADAYRSFFTGQSDYRVIWGILRWVLRQPMDLARRGLAKLDRGPRPNHPAFNWRFWEGFRTVMDQGKPVLALLAELDGETHEFNTEFKQLVLDRAPVYSRLCAVRLLPNTDHSFLFEEGRVQAHDAILEWLQSLHAENSVRTAAAS